MAYVSQELKKQIAPVIKALCAEYGVKGSLSVHNNSMLTLTVKSGKIDFHKDKLAESVNVYWVRDNYSGAAKAFLEKAVAALKGKNFFDHSDSQRDYFECSHYIDVRIGKWDAPYVLEK